MTMPARGAISHRHAVLAALSFALVLVPALCAGPATAARAHAASRPAHDGVAAKVASLAGAATGQTSSALTVRGSGPYAGLSVTVSQTKNLVDQNVDITWSGGAPTHSQSRYDANFLQVMQCWGYTSPDRTQCQYGGLAAFDTRGGENAASRQLKQALVADPAETLTKGSLPGQNIFVPFAAVTGVEVKGVDTLKNSFYDQTTTNEVPFARTRGDGRGYQSFEVLTGREAPGLGCGVLQETGPHKGTRAPCWLVIVPRGASEVDGSPYSRNSSLALDSSPLSASNWKHRMVVPLHFGNVGQPCSILADQTPTAGVESAAEAVSRWQPALCAGAGPVFGFNQVADGVIERQLTGDQPGLGFVNRPLAAGDVPPDRVMRYAPVALSGIAIAFNVDRQSAPDAPAAVRALDGTRVPTINLTPRLVAKLLTQSYRYAVGPNARYLGANPDNLTRDPDFLSVNPDFTAMTFSQSIEVLVPSGLSAVNEQLWQWIDADQDANDFVAGLPDPWGMRVNPFYQAMSLPVQAFPKVDPFCDAHAAPQAPALCTLDAHPYALDMHETARSLARGDSMSRTNWDANARPPAWKKAAPQLLGQRRLLAVTDTATASRFGLSVARLRNASGRFVAADDASLAAALGAMRPSGVPGVLSPDPTSTNPGAYPLASVTYAVTAPNILTADTAKRYADFIRYAVEGGQVRGTGVGQLPPGYTPLPTSWRVRARTAAAEIERRVGPPRTPPADGGEAPTAGAAGSGGAGAGPAGSGASQSAVAGGSGPGASVSPAGPGSGAAPSAPGSAPPGASAQAATGGIPPSEATGPVSTARTSGIDVGNARYAVLVALVLGGFGSIVGPLLRRKLARRL